MISKKDTEHIAELARLGLTEPEIKKFQKELSSILDYINLLDEVDVSNIEPTYHAFESKGVMRSDEVLSQDANKLIDLAPNKKDRLIKVKSVF
jgi:aspartyl-tRNA(Asn)/glutamyl-tRNA(Gln) amidotransferase subunit C